MDSDFEKVYKEYFRDVYLYVKHLSGGDEQLAEDITSETFFRALRAAGSFRGECSVRAWLCRIAKNCLFSYCKKSSREFAADDDVLDLKASSDEDPEKIVIQNEEAEKAKKLTASLPEVYRKVFILRAIGDMSFREIGRRFGKSENWACVTYHRARKMLREKMENARRER